MQNGYFNKAIKKINEINKISDIDSRVKNVCRLYSYINFCINSRYISSKEYDYLVSMIDNNPRDKILEEAEERDFKSLKENNVNLHEFYKKYLLLYSLFFTDNNIERKTFDLDINVYKVCTEFLKYMNCYNLYYELLSKHKISFNSKITNSTSFDDYYDTYIIINNHNRFNKYTSIAHEIGHAFEFRVLNGHKEHLLPRYGGEIISSLFDRIFNEFIIKSNSLTDEEIKIFRYYYEANNHDYLLIASHITDVMKQNEYKMFEYDIYEKVKRGMIAWSLDSHNYAIGNIAAINLIDEWRKEDRLFINKLPNIIKDIYNMKLNEIIEYFDNDEIFEDEIKKVLTK